MDRHFDADGDYVLVPVLHDGSIVDSYTSGSMSSANVGSTQMEQMVVYEFAEVQLGPLRKKRVKQLRFLMAQFYKAAALTGGNS